MVDLVRAGGKPGELSEEFGCTAQSIANWVAQAQRDTGDRKDGLTSSEREGLVRLRRENKQLRTEKGDPVKSRGLVCERDRRNIEEIFGSVKANQATYPVRVMCRLLKVSKSGFYAWLDRPTSTQARADIALSARIGATPEATRPAGTKGRLPWRLG